MFWTSFSFKRNKEKRWRRNHYGCVVIGFVRISQLELVAIDNVDDNFIDENYSWTQSNLLPSNKTKQKKYSKVILLLLWIAYKKRIELDTLLLSINFRTRDLVSGLTFHFMACQLSLHEVSDKRCFIRKKPNTFSLLSSSSSSPSSSSSILNSDILLVLLVRILLLFSCFSAADYSFAVSSSLFFASFPSLGHFRLLLSSR